MNMGFNYKDFQTFVEKFENSDGISFHNNIKSHIEKIASFQKEEMEKIFKYIIDEFDIENYNIFANHKNGNYSDNFIKFIDYYIARSSGRQEACLINQIANTNNFKEISFKLFKNRNYDDETLRGRVSYEFFTITKHIDKYINDYEKFLTNAKDSEQTISIEKENSKMSDDFKFHTKYSDFKKHASEVNVNMNLHELLLSASKLKDADKKKAITFLKEKFDFNGYNVFYNNDSEISFNDDNDYEDKLCNMLYEFVKASFEDNGEFIFIDALHVYQQNEDEDEDIDYDIIFNSLFKLLAKYGFNKEKLIKSIENPIEFISENDSFHLETTTLIKFLNNFEQYVKNVNSEPFDEKITEKEEKEMSKDKSANSPSKTESSKMDWVKERFVEGSYQGAAKVTVNTLSESLVSLVSATKPDLAQPVKEFLNTEVGFGILSAIIGAGTHFAPIPYVKENARVQKLADKCAENGVASVAEFAGMFAVNFIEPALKAGADFMTSKTASLPEVQTRVKVDNVTPIHDDVTFEEHIEPVKQKKAK